MTARNWPTKVLRPGEPYIVPSYLERASELRDAMRAPTVYPRSTSIIETWRCPNCREWTERGSFALGACTRCRLPRPI